MKGKTCEIQWSYPPLFSVTRKSPRGVQSVSVLPNQGFQSGDLVVYTVTKQSPHPGPRARSVHPAELGEDYSYVVDKFWMVVGPAPGNKLTIVTRKGKTRVVDATDPLLRKANWWQKFRYRDRFPSPEILQTLNAHGETSQA
jgi:hypothetical protein